MFETSLPDQFFDTLAPAILGIDVCGASGLDDLQVYNTASALWRQQITTIATNEGYIIVGSERQRIDPATGEEYPNKHTVNSFYLEFRFSLGKAQKLNG